MSYNTTRHRPDFQIKEGSRRPSFTYQLRHAKSNGGGIVDLEGAVDARFYLKHIDTDQLILNATAEIVDTDNALVEYEWAPEDPIVAGEHEAEVRVEYDDGSTHWLPENRNLVVRVAGGISGRELAPEDVADEDLEVREITVDRIQSASGGPISVESDTDYNGRNITNAGSVGGQTASFSQISGPNYTYSDWNVVETEDSPPRLRFNYNGTRFELGSGGARVFDEPTDPAHLVRKQDLDAIDTGGGGTGGGGTGDGWNPSEWGVLDVSNHGFPGDGTGGDIMAFIANNPNNVFVLPEGTYSVQSEIIASTTEWDQFVVRGEPHATLRVDDENVRAPFYNIGSKSGGVPYVSIQNVTVDISAGSHIDAGIGRIHAGERMYNKNIYLKGRRNHYALGVDGNTTRGDKFSYFACVTDEDGFGIHENIRLPDGDVWPGDVDRSAAIGMASDPPHVGTQIWVGCLVAEHWDNGMYIKGAPEGTNILVGPIAINNGRANIRIGANDQIIGGRSIWNMDPTHAHYPEPDATGTTSGFGTLLSSDRSRGTAVLGFYGLRETGTQDCVRTWSGSGPVAFRDMYIENHTDQWAVRCGANDAHGDSAADSIGEKSVAKFDNVHIRENSGNNTRAASVISQREHLVFDSATYYNDSAGSARAFAEISSGEGLRVENSNIEVSGGNAFHLSTDFDKLEVSESTLHGGFYLYGAVNPNALRVSDCDMRNVSSLWTASGTPDQIGSFAFYGNIGWEDYNRFASGGIMTDDSQQGRKVYVSSTEPTGWSDGDLWVEPQ